MKCKHPRKQRQRLNHADWAVCYDCNICRACGAWFSLGPSKDTRRARIEMRAAELAHAAERDDWSAFEGGYEWIGWLDHAGYESGTPQTDAWTAGYLAREIWDNHRPGPSLESAYGCDV